jgi:protein TonB
MLRSILLRVQHLKTQTKITILVVLIHILLITGFQWGTQRSSANQIGDMMVASLLDPNPSPEKKSSTSTKQPPSKQVRVAVSSTTTASSSITQETPSTPPPSSLGGSSTGEPKSISMSQAQCSVPEPFYPGLSRRMGEEGKALVRLYINEAGAVERVQLAQSSGIQRLDQSALDAAMKARCKPFVEFGKPIKVSAIQPYIFRLE